MATEYRNPISGPLKPITKQQLFALADPEVNETLARLLFYGETTAIVVFEVLQMDSSQCGHRQFLSIGPTRTYKTIAEVAPHHLGDVPSRFAYPVSYYEKEPQA